MYLSKNLEAVEKNTENILKSSFNLKLNIPTKNKRRIAFTLAEILITLLIIGVVASLIIPALINDIQDAEFHTAWKHDYAIISQATKQLMTDTGSDLNSYLTTTGSLCNALKPYLNYTKFCTYPNRNCWIDPNSFKELDNSTPYYDYFDDGGFILNNGHLIVFENNSNPNTTFIWVDVNGFKKPNIIGKDIYGIKVYQNCIKPLGSSNDIYTNTCSNTNTGWGCAAKYLMQ